MIGCFPTSPAFPQVVLVALGIVGGIFLTGWSCDLIILLRTNTRARIWWDAVDIAENKDLMDDHLGLLRFTHLVTRHLCLFLVHRCSIIAATLCPPLHCLFTTTFGLVSSLVRAATPFILS